MMEDAQAQAAVPVLVDAHVHFHSCFDRDLFLDSALANFRRGAGELGIAGPFLGCLLLAEAAGERWFERCRDGYGGAWRFEANGEPASLVARRADGERLLVIAGRQVRTRERLEVLALVSTEEFPDGLPFADALARVRWSGAVPVLPWGFGKWWFYRGAMIEAFLRRPQPKWVFLGDNAGRPAVAGRPRLFREASKRGIPVLPGSDPLPLPEHAARAGSAGFLLDGGVDERTPAAQLWRLLRALTVQPRTFGRCEGLTRFLQDQLALRHLRASPALPAAGARRPTTTSPWTR